MDLAAEPLVAEAAHLVDDRQQRPALPGQLVLDPRRRLRVAPPDDDVLRLEPAEALGERPRADPLAGIAAGVRRTIDDRPAWCPEQVLTVEQALRASTVTPAWLAGDERRRGKLLPGFLADLVVLDRDPVSGSPDELPELSVVATMVGGRWVHNPPPWD